MGESRASTRLKVPAKIITIIICVRCVAGQHRIVIAVVTCHHGSWSGQHRYCTGRDHELPSTKLASLEERSRVPEDWQDTARPGALEAKGRGADACAESSVSSPN